MSMIHFVICRNLNGQIGKVANGYKEAHGGHGYDKRNRKGKHNI